MFAMTLSLACAYLFLPALAVGWHLFTSHREKRHMGQAIFYLLKSALWFGFIGPFYAVLSAFALAPVFVQGPANFDNFFLMLLAMWFFSCVRGLFVAMSIGLIAGAVAEYQNKWLAYGVPAVSAFILCALTDGALSDRSTPSFWSAIGFMMKDMESAGSSGLVGFLGLVITKYCLRKRLSPGCKTEEGGVLAMPS